MIKFQRICLALSAIALALLITGLLLSQPAFWQPAALGLAVCFAIAIGAIPAIKGYQYTAWIAAAVVAGMIYPSAFLRWGDFDLRNKYLILIIIQLVMFGMGTQMSIHDFTQVAKNKRGILVGLLGHFTIMPLLGVALTKVFNFDDEIAAGIILIGSCASGLASNVMVYLARANLALSVTVTAMSTLAAPFMTPFLMKMLAGTLIEVHFFDMMMEIIKIVIIPIAAALLYNHVKTTYPSTAFGKIAARLDKYMPLISMFGIVYFTTVTTAAGRDNLMKVGFLLFIASVLHNAGGYFFGYWVSRIFGIDKNSARTIAFEVGLQNGGMASGLAGTMGKLGTVGLAAAVFSPWMNISGSILANYWKRKPVDDNLTLNKTSHHEP